MCDQVLFEFFYVIGMRVSECCMFIVSDFDLFMDMVFVYGKGRKQCYILFGLYVCDVLELYINSGRQCLFEKVKEFYDVLFVN